MQIGTRGRRGKGMKRPTLEVRRLKFKVTRRRSYICRPGEGTILDPFGRVGFLVRIDYQSQSICTNKSYG